MLPDGVLRFFPRCYGPYLLQDGGAADWSPDGGSPDWFLDGVSQIGSHIGYLRGSIGLLPDRASQIGCHIGCPRLAPRWGTPYWFREGCPIFWVTPSESQSCVPHLEANLVCHIWEQVFSDSILERICDDPFWNPSGSHLEPIRRAMSGRKSGYPHLGANLECHIWEPILAVQSEG